MASQPQHDGGKSDAATESEVPVAKALDMTEWQQGMKTVQARDTFLMEQEMFFDCHLSVGKDDDIEKFPAHRLYLAKTSPYFATLFYGAMKKKGSAVIKISDVSPRIFRILLGYVYSGTVKVTDIETAFEILQAAKMYLFPDALLSDLRNYLWNQIYPSKMWEILQYASAYDEQELVKTAWRLIEEKTSVALRKDGFLDIPMSLLEKLVLKDSLTCSEVELFNACLRWADKEAGRQGINPEPASLRTILEPVIPHIRVLAMSSRDVVEHVRVSGIFTKEEIFPVITNTVVRDAEKIPETICPSPVQRRKPEKGDNFFVFGTPQVMDEKYDNQLTIDCFVSANISFSKTRTVVGVEVPSQIKELKPGDSKEYEENLTVLVLEESYYNSKSVVLKNVFKKVVKYNSIIEIPFSNTYKTPPGSTTLAIKVIFHETGLYPLNKKRGFIKDPICNADTFDGKSVYKYLRESFWYVNSIVTLT